LRRYPLLALRLLLSFTFQGPVPSFYRFVSEFCSSRLALANEYMVKNAGKDLSQRISPSSSFRIFLGTFCSSMIPKCQSTFKFRQSHGLFWKKVAA
jgi:hypothetical protein